ncbi:uncharacterized protein LOC126748563 isoform X2 [Anthonomus grandis grandis]|nr:uncharacterized protein LOC126748563 isoform X2 [Anthonomus grandis grandis]
MIRQLFLFGLIAAATAERKAVVSIVGTDVKGSVYFTETSDGILIEGSISGLTPGKHGFHIHAIGDITGGCASTGAHFNPYNATHGAPDASERHVGDLGNIEANATGIAEIKFVDKIISLDGTNNILGRGVVVHQDEDDLGLGGAEDSKTTGHAGARVGCGVIGTL